MSAFLRGAGLAAARGMLCIYATGAAAANLVTNPDFDINLNGWMSGDHTGYNEPSATFALNTTDGSPGAPSAELAAAIFDQISIAHSNCIVIDAIQSADLYANVKIISGSATLLVFAFSDTVCNPLRVMGETVAPIVVYSPGGVWQQVSSLNFPLLAGAHSVVIELYANHGSTIFPAFAHTLFDHIVFQQSVATPVRLQSFEVK